MKARHVRLILLTVSLSIEKTFGTLRFVSSRSANYLFMSCCHFSTLVNEISITVCLPSCVF